MNWNNYLLENKSPFGTYAHLGVLEGDVSGIFDLSQVPLETKVLTLSTPLKKFKLSYTNLLALSNNTLIEAISVGDLDEERLAVFATLPNLKYLQISNNKQSEIPNLACLKNLEVLILASIKNVDNIDFIQNMTNLKTLYVYGITNMVDLTPLSTLSNLEELTLDHGKLSGIGKAVENMDVIGKLTQLKYLHFTLEIGKIDFNAAPLFNLKKLQKLHLLPKYWKKVDKERLRCELPLLKTANAYF